MLVEIFWCLLSYLSWADGEGQVLIKKKAEKEKKKVLG